MTLEKQIENKVSKWAKASCWICHKVRFAENGWPDRLYIHPLGLHVWIEYKRPGQVPAPLQIERIRTLLDQGVKAGWTDNYEDAIYFLSILDAKVLSVAGYKIAPQSGIRWSAA